MYVKQAQRRFLIEEAFFWAETSLPPPLLPYTLSHFFEISNLKNPATSSCADCRDLTSLCLRLCIGSQRAESSKWFLDRVVFYPHDLDRSAGHPHPFSLPFTALRLWTHLELSRVSIDYRLHLLGRHP